VHKQRFSETDFYGPNGGKTFFGANLDLLFRYHLDLWGKDRALLDAALGKERAQASELAMVKLMLSTSIARSYFRLCGLEQGSQLAQALIAQSEAKLHLAQVRWQQGLETQDAVHLGKQKLAVAQQRKTSLSTQAQKLRNQLAALVGQGADWGHKIRISDSRFAHQFPLPKNLSLGLLAHRPDVAASLWRAEAAAQLIKVAKTNFYPDVNLVGFSGLHSLNLKDLFLSHGASLAYSVGPTITLPIFEGGRLEARLKNEQAGYDMAVETYNATLLTAVQQVADSLAYWRETVSHDAAQEQAIKAAEAKQKLSEKRYQAGLSARDGVIEAKATLLEQQLKNTELAAEHLQAAVALIEALGGGYENPASTNNQIGQLK
jgi:NodT family efflux transporter outer membrane factor (OMF) lipoprotein